MLSFMGFCMPSFHRWPAGTLLVASLCPRSSLDFWPFFREGEERKAPWPWDLHIGGTQAPKEAALHRLFGVPRNSLAQKFQAAFVNPPGPATGEDGEDAPENVIENATHQRDTPNLSRKRAAKGEPAAGGLGWGSRGSLPCPGLSKGCLVQSRIPDQSARTHGSFCGTRI